MTIVFDKYHNSRNQCSLKKMQTLQSIVQAYHLTTQYLHAYIFVTQKIPISAHYSMHAS